MDTLYLTEVAIVAAIVNFALKKKKTTKKTLQLSSRIIVCSNTYLYPVL